MQRRHGRSSLCATPKDHRFCIAVVGANPQWQGARTSHRGSHGADMIAVSRRRPGMAGGQEGAEAFAATQLPKSCR